MAAAAESATWQNQPISARISSNQTNQSNQSNQSKQSNPDHRIAAAADPSNGLRALLLRHLASLDEPCLRLIMLHLLARLDLVGIQRESGESRGNPGEIRRNLGESRGNPVNPEGTLSPDWPSEGIFSPDSEYSLGTMLALSALRVSSAKISSAVTWRLVRRHLASGGCESTFNGGESTFDFVESTRPGGDLTFDGGESTRPGGESTSNGGEATRPDGVDAGSLARHMWECALETTSLEQLPAMIDRSLQVLETFLPGANAQRTFGEHIANVQGTFGTFGEQFGNIQGTFRAPADDQPGRQVPSPHTTSSPQVTPSSGPLRTPSGTPCPLLARPHVSQSQSQERAAHGQPITGEDESGPANRRTGPVGLSQSQETTSRGRPIIGEDEAGVLGFSPEPQVVAAALDALMRAVLLWARHLATAGWRAANHIPPAGALEKSASGAPKPPGGAPKSWCC